jgi:hypothetical protein
MLPAQARAKIQKRGRDIGLDFDGEVAALRGAADWDAEMRAVQDPTLRYPAYYMQPFHAYRDGNLCLEAALQVRDGMHMCTSLLLFTLWHGTGGMSENGLEKQLLVSTIMG